MANLGLFKFVAGAGPVNIAVCGCETHTANSNTKCCQRNIPETPQLTNSKWDTSATFVLPPGVSGHSWRG